MLNATFQSKTLLGSIQDVEAAAILKCTVFTIFDT